MCTSSAPGQLDEGERHLGLDADDDGLGASQPRHVRKIVERFRGERVEDVERGHVDDDSSRPVDADLVDEIGLELHQLLVVERGVDGGDQEVPLAKDRDEHRDDAFRSALLGACHPEAELPLGLLDPALEVADRVHLG